MKSSQSGLTLIEMLLVVGIIMTLLSISFISISNIRIVSSGSSATTVFISDLKNQQIKAMTGDTEGRGIGDNYGVKVLTDRYILFHGLSYVASDSSNFSIPVDSGHSLSSTFTNGLIIFASNSGELVNFVVNNDSVTITDNDGSAKTMRFNKYGTVTQIN